MKRHDSCSSLLAISLLFGLTTAFLPSFASAQHVQQHPTPEGDPIGAGWWRLNQEKSQYPPNTSALARTLMETRHYYLRDDGFWVMSIFTELSDGRRAFSQTVFKLDGQARQSTYTDETLAEFQAKGTVATATSSQTATDQHTVNINILAADGSVVTTNTRVLAKDGASFTLTTETTDDRGALVKTTRIFERIAH
jgi:hypothetical protein